MPNKQVCQISEFPHEPRGAPKSKSVQNYGDISLRGICPRFVFTGDNEIARPGVSRTVKIASEVERKL